MMCELFSVAAHITICSCPICHHHGAASCHAGERRVAGFATPRTQTEGGQRALQKSTPTIKPLSEWAAPLHVNYGIAGESTRKPLRSDQLHIRISGNATSCLLHPTGLRCPHEHTDFRTVIAPRGLNIPSSTIFTILSLPRRVCGAFPLTHAFLLICTTAA